MGGSEPRVSVVVPLYNKVSYVARFMATIRQQTYTDYEVVIVDDGSTDGSPDAVRPLLTERDVLVSQQNAGCGAARNTGIGHSKGVYVALIDADDEWHPEFLETMVRLLDHHPQAGVAACRYAQVWQDGATVFLPMVFPDEPPEGVITDILALSAAYGEFVCHVSSVVIRREVLVSVGGFLPTGECEVGSEDHDLWVRIALAEWLTAYTDRALAKWHRGVAGSITSVGRTPACPLLVKTARERLAGDDVAAHLQVSLERICATSLGAWAFNLIRAGLRKEARRAINEAGRLWPAYPARYRLLLKSYLPNGLYRWLLSMRSRLSRGSAGKGSQG